MLLCLIIIINYFPIYNKYHKINFSISQKKKSFTHMNWFPAILLSASLTHSKTTGFPLSSRYAPFRNLQIKRKFNLHNDPIQINKYKINKITI
jgi:hypothetical protein